MRTRLRILGATAATSVVAVAVPLLSSSDAHAARFTGGDLVVYRVGTGAAALTNAAAPVFLDEFGPTGSRLQSVALPSAASNGNQPLTATGQSRSEGLLSRSADGRFLALTGYAVAPGTTGPGGISLTASDPSSVGRTVGLVDANGIADTSTVLTGASVPKIIRSAATTDGDRLWAAGGNGGVATTTLGSAAVGTVAGTADSNLTSLTIQGGQLFSGGIFTDRLATVGTGAPTAGATLGDLAGLPANLLTYGYAFLDLTGAGYAGTPLDTLYVANASSRGGTVDKYRFDGSSWTAVGSTDVPGAFGLVADTSGSAVSLAVTTPTTLVSLTDQAGAATTFEHAAPTVLATAATNTEFRGVALAPTATPGPSVYLRSPATGTTAALGTALPVSAYVDSPSGVGSVQARLGSGSFVDATRHGKVWTASVPTDGLTAGAATLTVRATDLAGSPASSTVTRSVTLTGSGAPAGALTAGKYAWTAKQVALKGTWRKYATTHAPGGKGLTSSVAKARATATTYGRGVAVTFDRGPKAGKVKVTVGGKSVTIDLFSRTAKALTRSWAFTGPAASHQVVVTVLGKKNAASKGKAAFLAALTVKR